MGMTSLLLEYTGQQFIKDLSWIVVILVSIAGALSTLYAVYIAYLFFTASDPTKRKAAKDRLVKVVSSSIIIVALAGILATLDVTFVQQSGNYSGPQAGGNKTGYADAYTYSVRPEANLSVTDQQGGLMITGEFKLFNADLRGDGAPIDKYGTATKFSKCAFVAPAGWPSPLKFVGEPTCKAEQDDSGANYMTVTFRLLAENMHDKVAIPVVSQDPNLITISAEFGYVSNLSKAYTATVNVVLKSSSGKVQFYKSA